MIKVRLRSGFFLWAPDRTPPARACVGVPSQSHYACFFLFSFFIPTCQIYICIMNTPLAFVTTTIRLRGHRFPSGCVVRVWKTGSVTSIQPFNLPTAAHSALWYVIPQRLEHHLRPLNDTECVFAEWEFYSRPDSYKTKKIKEIKNHVKD
jgi:hypothetical protein